MAGSEDELHVRRSSPGSASQRGAAPRQADGAGMGVEPWQGRRHRAMVLGGVRADWRFRARRHPLSRVGVRAGRDAGGDEEQGPRGADGGEVASVQRRGGDWRPCEVRGGGRTSGASASPAM